MTLVQHRPDGRVLKLMSASASVPIAWTDATPVRHLRDYVGHLAAAGVCLPTDLTLTTCGIRPAVQHRWLAGVPLPDLAATDRDGFVAHVQRIATYVRALDATPARLDTNLANFLLTPDGLTCIDVLPPLLTPLRPPARDAWQTLFGALCYETDIILCALAGYAARALLDHSEPRRQDAADLALCPGHLKPDRLAVRWFHSRGHAALTALNGDRPARAVLETFRATSMLRLRNTPGDGRDTLINAGLATLAALGDCE